MTKHSSGIPSHWKKLTSLWKKKQGDQSEKCPKTTKSERQSTATELDISNSSSDSATTKRKLQPSQQVQNHRPKSINTYQTRVILTTKESDDSKPLVESSCCKKLKKPLHLDLSSINNSNNDEDKKSQLICKSVRGKKVGNLNISLCQIDTTAKFQAAKTCSGSIYDEKYRSSSSIIADFMYVGGSEAANNKKELLSLGITHIINCAGTVTPNFFNDDFCYYKIKLRDHSSHDITRHFYNVLDFIESCKASGGRIFIHCVKGISRSPSMAIAYLIYFLNLNLEEALIYMRKSRPITNPNTGFIFQISEWEFLRKSSIGKGFQIKLPTEYCASSNNSKNPLIISTTLIPALIEENCFVISSDTVIYLWYGKQTSNELVQAAERAIYLLQKYDKMPVEKEIIHEGKETENFRELCNSLR